VAAVIDALGAAGALQGEVLNLGPSRPPVVHLAGRFHVQFAGLGPQTLGAKLARGQQQVGVMVARRKIIAGSLLLDALKNGSTIRDLPDLMSRITRDVDRKAFDGWSLTDER
jgi:hypothetical protein